MVWQNINCLNARIKIHLIWSNILLISIYFLNKNFLNKFADPRNGNNNFNTPSSLFEYYTWYYCTVTVDYLSGLYSALGNFKLMNNLNIFYN